MKSSLSLLKQQWRRRCDAPAGRNYRRTVKRRLLLEPLEGRRLLVAPAEQLYAVRGSATEVAIVQLDPADGSVLESFPAPQVANRVQGVQGLAVGPESIFYLDAGLQGWPHYIYELDPDTGHVVDADLIDSTLALKGAAYLDGLLYFEKEFGKIVVFDPATDTITTTLEPSIGSNNHALAASPDGNLYVANDDTKRIFRLDPSTGATRGFFSHNLGPVLGLAFFAGDLLASTVDNPPVIHRLDPLTGASRGSFTVPGANTLISALGGDGVPIASRLALSLSIAPALDRATIREAGSAGASTAMATVYRHGGDLGEPVMVQLSSSDTTEAAVPASVVIDRGESQASFTIAGVDDTLLDGRQRALIEATILATAVGLDTSFNFDGIAGTNSVQAQNIGALTALLPDGRVWGIGVDATLDNTWRITRLTSEGDSEGDVTTRPGPATPAALDAVPTAVAVQPDGRVLVAGAYRFAGAPDRLIPVVFRYLSSGALDTSFGTSGELHLTLATGGVPTDILVQPDGSILVAGINVGVNGTVTWVQKYGSTGGHDTSYGGDGTVDGAIGGVSGWIEIARQSDGKVLIVQSGDDEISVRRVEAGGLADLGFGTKAFDQARTAAQVVVQPDGNFLIASTDGADVKVLRIDESGSLDAGFGTGGVATFDIGGGVDQLQSLLLQTDGRIVLLGGATVSGDLDPYVARLDAGGSVDTSFDFDGVAWLPRQAGTDESLWSGELQQNGKLVGVVGNPAGLSVVRLDMAVQQTANNIIYVNDYETIAVDVDPNEVSERTSMVTGTVRVSNTDRAADLTVNLRSSDETEATVPDTATIPAGAQSIDFPITIVNDAIVDGIRRVYINASSPGYFGQSGVLDVLDDEGLPPAELRVTIDASSMSEFGGTAMGEVRRVLADESVPLTVMLGSDDTGEATVPPSVTIAAGEDSATFTIAAQDDALLDGTQTITVSASAMGLVGGEATIDVLDYETLTISYALNRDTLSESGGRTTASVQRSNVDAAQPLTVALSSNDTSEATVPASVTIPIDTANEFFDVSAVDDAFLDGSQVVQLTASAPGYVDGTVTLTVTDFETIGISIDATEINEDGGTATATVSRSNTDDLSQAQLVALSSSDSTEAVVPAMVVIPANTVSVAALITAVDDTLLDGLREVRISATAPGYIAGHSRLNVSDRETVSISLDPLSIAENGGTTTATVTRNNSDLTRPLSLSIFSSDTSEASVPAIVTIPANQPSTTFPVTGVDDDLLDGPQPVEISAAEYYAAAAAIDDSFGSNGYVEPLASLDWMDRSGRLAVLPNGKFLVAANVSDTIEGTFSKLLSLTRHHPDGQLDTAFGDQGFVLTSVNGLRSHSAYGLIIQPDGKILMAAEAGSGYVLRFQPDGATDTGFGQNGVAVLGALTNAPYSMALQSDGRIVVAYGDDGAIHVERLLPDGNRDFSFGSDGIVSIAVGPRPPEGFEAAVELLPDGQILVTAGSDTGLVVARLNAGGDLDAGFGNGGKTTIAFPGLPVEFDEYFARSLLVDPGGRVVVVGRAAGSAVATSGALLVARLTSGGALDTSFNADGIDSRSGDYAVGASRLQADGRLVIGAGNRSGGSGGGLLLRYLEDGTLDSEFGVAGQLDLSTIHREVVRHLVFTPDGDLLTLAGEASPGVRVGRVGLFEDRYEAIAPASLTVVDHESLALTIDPTSISESGGSATGTVMRGNVDLNSPLVVTLMSDDTSEATTPTTVTVPIGAATATFPIAAVDDSDLDGAQTVTISAEATGYVGASEQLIVADFEELTVNVAAGSISEDGGATTAVVTRSGTNGSLTVTLSSDDPSEAIVPATVTIAAGQTSSTAFPITAVDDNLLDGARLVTVTASAEGYVAGTDRLTVTDLERLVASIADASISENGGVSSLTVTRTDPSGELTVMLTSDDTSEANVAASVTIPDGATTSNPIAIASVDDALVDGTQTVTIEASAMGYVAAGDSIDVTDYEQLIVSIAEDSIAEDGGSSTVTVTRTDPRGELTVSLASSDTGEAIVDSRVTIPDGETTSANVAITSVDDDLLDGEQTVTITASALGYVAGTDTLSVTDSEALSVSILDATIAENGGTTTGVVTRPDDEGDVVVMLVSNRPGDASVDATVLIPDGETVSPPFNIDAHDNDLLDGERVVTITATAADYVGGSDTVVVDDFELLNVAISAASISEQGGTTTATLTRSNTDRELPLVVMLQSSDTGEATVPPMVTIDANAESATFSVSAVDDALLDGTQTISISASADGYAAVGDDIDVTDHEQLQISLNDMVISEAGGMTTAVVTRTDPAGTLDITLTSSDTTEATIVGSITIAAGQTVSAPINISSVDDVLLDGTQVTTLTASAAGYLQAEVELQVADAEPLTLSVEPSRISENGGAATGTVTRTDATGDLLVDLSSDDTSEAAVPETVLIPSGNLSATFPVTAVDDALLDGTQPVTIQAVAAGYDSDSATLDVTDREQLVVSVEHVEISENGGFTTATITRTDPSGDLTVFLGSSNQDAAIVPASITIPANSLAATVPVTAVDDDLLDGTQSATITAVAIGYVAGHAAVAVSDYEPLTLEINAMSISERGGSTTAVVTRTDPNGSLFVNLTSSDIGEASVPPTVLIPDGQISSPPFTIFGVDDPMLDGTQTVIISAESVGYISADDTLAVDDFEPLTVAITDRSISENGGATSATVSRTDPSGDLTVMLVSDDLTEAAVASPVTIADGETTSPVFEITAVDDALVDGPRIVTIEATATGYIRGQSTLTVTDHELLTLSIIDNEISEDGGVTTATVTRTDPRGTLTVVLLNSDSGEANVPGSVLLQDGQATSDPFQILGVDDTSVDGDQVVTFTAVGSGYAAATNSITVTDAEPLTLTIADDRISEEGGATAAVVTRTDPNGDLTVTLVSDDDGEAVLTPTVVIPDGETSSPPVSITAVDDDLLDGTQSVTFTASSAGYIDATDQLLVDDFEQIVLTIAADAISEKDGTTTATVARSNQDRSLPLTVQLASSDVGAATVPASVTIPADAISTAFTILATDDTLLDGTQSVVISPSATGYEPTSDSLDVTDYEPLVIMLSDASFSESGGTTMGTVVRTDPAGEVTVTLATGDPSEVDVPAAVVLGDGIATAAFTITAVDDALLDGTQTATITAETDGYIAGEASIEVTDYELLLLTLADEQLSEDGGETIATVTRTDPTGDWIIDLSIDDSTEATVPNAVVIPDGATSASFTVAAVDDALVDGEQSVTIMAAAVGYVDAEVDLTVTDLEQLVLSISDPTISERGGMTTGTVTRTDVTGDLLVTLTADDTTEADVPASITIFAGETTATFSIQSVDDRLLDGTQSVAVSASAPGYVDAAETLDVSDYEQLALTLAAASISEQQGSTQATVTLPGPVAAEDLHVSIVLDDVTEAAAPETIVIRAGASSASFAIDAVDDALVDGTQTVAIQVSAAGYVGAAASIDITDHEELTLALLDDVISENGGATTATVTRSDVSGDLIVALTVDDASEADVPIAVTIPDGGASVSFSITAVDDLLLDGAIDVAIGASAVGYVEDAAQVTVTDHETLTLSIATSTISEPCDAHAPAMVCSQFGPSSTLATLTRSNEDHSSALDVVLSLDMTDQAAVPSIVTIPAGQLSVEFVIEASPDDLLDGTQEISIESMADGYEGGFSSLEVTDAEWVMLGIHPDSISELDGAFAVSLDFSALPSGGDSIPALDSLVSDDPSEAIASWSSSNSTQLLVDAIDDLLLDGDQPVEIDVTFLGYASARVEVTVTDHETLTLTLDADLMLESASTLNATIRRDNQDIGASLTVTLQSSDPGEANVPAEVTIAAGETSATFAVTAIEDGLPDGDQQVEITVAAAGYVGSSAELTVVDTTLPWQNPMNRFDVDDNNVVASFDVLRSINEINRNGARVLPVPDASLAPPPFYDVNGDGSITSNDVLQVINEINRQIMGEGEDVLRPDHWLRPEIPVLKVVASRHAPRAWPGVQPSPRVPSLDVVLFADTTSKSHGRTDKDSTRGPTSHAAELEDLIAILATETNRRRDERAGLSV